MPLNSHTHPIIRFDRVSVVAQTKTILSNISFAIDKGQKVMLSGKSGAGKSSVLRTLFGMHTIKSGMVYFQGQALSAQTVQAIRSRTAYIGQEPILGAENVRDAMLLPFQFHAHRHRQPSETEILEVLQRLKLPPEILQRESQRVSGGEKQRIALARSLLLGKTVYLLDEVTSALDSDSKQAVFEVFAEHDFTVLAVSHDPEWSQRCDRIFEIESGTMTEVNAHGNSRH